MTNSAATPVTHTLRIVGAEPVEFDKTRVFRSVPGRAGGEEYGIFERRGTDREFHVLPFHSRHPSHSRQDMSAALNTVPSLHTVLSTVFPLTPRGTVQPRHAPTPHAMIDSREV